METGSGTSYGAPANDSSPVVAALVRFVALVECARSAGTIDAWRGWGLSNNRRIQNG
jgi:hypothetical protein